MAGFFTRIKQFFTPGPKKVQGPTEQRGVTIRNPIPWLLESTSSGVSVTEKTTVSISAISRGLDLIGGSIGSMPFLVMEEDADDNLQKRKDHAYWYLLKNEPHPFYTTFDFLKALVYQVKLRGNGIALLFRGLVSNRVQSIRLIEWDYVIDMMEDEENGVIWYKIKGYEKPFPHTDVIHIKNLTPNGVCGLDTLKIHKDSFGLDLASKETAGSIYKNNAQIGGYLSTDQKLRPEQRKAIDETWHRTKGGSHNAGKWAVLEGGLEAKSLNLTPHEAQLNEARQYNVYEAARILGLSPHLLFALDRANFSNIETLNLEYRQFTLTPLVESIEQEFTRKLFTRDSERGSIKAMLDMDAFLRSDPETRIKYLVGSVQNGLMSFNEARRKEGNNSLPNGDRRMVPKNMSLLDEDGNIVPESSESNNMQPGDIDASDFERMIRSGEWSEVKEKNGHLNGHSIKN